MILPEDPPGWTIPFVDGEWWPVSSADGALQMGGFSTKRKAVNAIVRVETRMGSLPETEVPQ